MEDVKRSFLQRPVIIRKAVVKISNIFSLGCETLDLPLLLIPKLPLIDVGIISLQGSTIQELNLLHY